MDLYQRFTDRARKVMQLANQEAQRWNHEYIGTEHVLIALAKESSGVAASILKNEGLEVKNLRDGLEVLVSSGEKTTGDRISLNTETEESIEYARSESDKLNNGYIGTEHLLLGVLTKENNAVKIIRNLGKDIEQLREKVYSLLGHGEEKESDEVSEALDLISKVADESAERSGIATNSKEQTSQTTQKVPYSFLRVYSDIAGEQLREYPLGDVVRKTR